MKSKLVRDNIPSIIKKDGKKPIVRLANHEQKIQLLKEKLSKHPNVQSIAASDRVPVNQGNFSIVSKWDEQEVERNVLFHMMSVDDDYMTVLGTQMAEVLRLKSLWMKMPFLLMKRLYGNWEWLIR